MSSDFNENTRVQVPAALHLCRLVNPEIHGYKFPPICAIFFNN